MDTDNTVTAAYVWQQRNKMLMLKKLQQMTKVKYFFVHLKTKELDMFSKAKAEWKHQRQRKMYCCML